MTDPARRADRRSRRRIAAHHVHEQAISHGLFYLEPMTRHTAWWETRAYWAGASHLGHALKCLRAMSKTEWFRVTSDVMDGYHITETMKRRGLRRLERAGLIEVRGSQGIIPEVRIIEVTQERIEVGSVAKGPLDRRA
jgi:hypothetical protein